MCDQTEVSYLDGDVVWVKIGPVWWPGVVTDLEKTEEGKEILAGLRKKPIASVKFFNEDNYEYVKNLDHIYHYNCRKKDEFIKKGLDKYRTGTDFMKKFPADVTTAEGLVHGDVNIINDPKFQPEEKQSYSDIFGSGKKKKKKEAETPTPSRGRGARASTSTPSYRPITHQRFIKKALHGESDHKVKELIQPTGSGEDAAGNKYKCHVCKFETTRVNVIVAHNRLSHSSNTSVTWIGSDSKLVRRKPTYKSRKPKSKKLFESFDEEESNDVSYEEPKKRKSPAKSPAKSSKASKDKKAEAKVASPAKSATSSPGKRKANDEVVEAADQKKPRYTDALLADWSEDEDDDEKDKMETEHDTEESKVEDASETKEKEDKEEKEESETKTDDKPVSKPPKKEAAGGSKKQMSCFDFDEEEDGFIGMSNANTYGRKIPRVIPVKDKSDLGVDLEIEELFKRKSESDYEDVKNDEEGGDDGTVDEDSKTDKEAEKGDEGKPATAKKRGRKPKAKAEEKKLPEPAKVEDSLAMRRTRRPGARKSYLNEVIEKIDDGSPSTSDRKDIDQPDLDFSDQEIQTARVEVRRATREEGSSRRKQDLKIHATSRDELIYSDIVKTDPKKVEKRGRKRSNDKSQSENEDLTKEIDKLLTETNLPVIPVTPEKKNLSTSSEEPNSNTLSLSFDYVPSEQPPKKIFAKLDNKGKPEVKSISKLFSDSIIAPESTETKVEESKTITESNIVLQKEGSPVKTVTSPLSSPRKKVILSSIPKIVESSGGHVTVLPIVKTTNAGGEGSCVILSSGKKVITEAKQDSTEGGPRMKTIKTIKIKPENLPPSLLASGKIKPGHRIIQKGGKYVIVSPQPVAGQPKIIPGKPGTPNKVVIVTNQHGEQKIITSGGLKQSKLAQKIITTTTESDKGDSSASGSGLATVSKAQPIIKMVPDGKGGVMKTLSVTPKKVILQGGTKVLVSPSSSPQKETIQKIALPAGGGDLRLIENYKGSGKTFIIQGSSATGNVIYKSSSSAPRQTVSRVIQSPQKILSLKKNPKIVMRTSTGQSEFVVHSGPVGSGESPTYVMKKPDGKFATQKILRRPIVQAKASTSGAGSKTIYLSQGQVATQKGESIIIKSNQEPVTNIVRLKPVVKDQESGAATKTVQKVVQKPSEVYTLPQNSYVLPAETTEQTTEVLQTVPVGDQTQPPLLQTQVVAMPGPIGADGNQTYVLVSVDEHGLVQTVDNSIIAYDISAQQDPVYVNPTNTNNVILINNQPSEELTPVYSTASQDILAEALANTNVLEGSINTEIEPVMPSILLPPAIPSSVVQETSITLQKPIMTPLEMPSSVAPDTSGLEPPPLPPTPTEEDVLMEEPEGNVIQEEEIVQDKSLEESQVSQVVEEETLCSNVITTETFTVSGNEQTLDTSVEETYQETVYQEEGEKTENFDNSNGNVTEEGMVVEENNVVEYYPTEDYQEVKQQETTTPGEDFIIENSQEEQGGSSFQSMPLLNDEPDTSDDAGGSEPIADQDFELQKSRMGNGEFSPLLREQEPPSSTNCDIVTESNYESNEGYQVSADNTYREDQPSQEEETKEKETSDDKDTQSMPLITDEGNINSYEIDPMYADVINQKRFQEETEVSSTTDEFTNKDNVV